MENVEAFYAIIGGGTLQASLKPVFHCLLEVDGFTQGNSWSLKSVVFESSPGHCVYEV